MKRAYLTWTFASCAALAVLIFAATGLPNASLYWLPTLAYGCVLCAGVSAWTRRGFDAHWLLGTCFVAVVFMLGAQTLISVQGAPTRWLAWGRFPLGDSADFISNALLLLTDGTFVSIRGRPMANAFIAGVWSSVNFDLVLLSLVISTLCALSLALFLVASNRVFGLIPAMLAGAVVFDFAHEHIGAASTEPIGFFLGLIAASMLVLAAAYRSGPYFIMGFGALVLAYLYLVGPVFVLPCLLLWPFIAPIERSRRVSVFVGIVGCLVSLMVLNNLVSQKLTPTSPSFVNAPKSWYAIIVMGDEFLGVRPEGSVRDEARWVQIFDDHPGLKERPIHEQGPRFLEIVAHAALDRPFSVLVGAGLEYGDQLGRAGLFRFVENKPVRIFVFVLFLLGLVRAFKNLRQVPLATLIFLAGVGQVASIPFLHGGENRVHIANAGIMAATVAYGVSGLIAMLNPSDRAEGRGTPRQSVATTIFGSRFFPAAAVSLMSIPVVISLWVTFGTAGTFSCTLPHPTLDCGSLDVPNRHVSSPGSTVGVGVPSESPLSLTFDDQNHMRRAIDAWAAVKQENSVFFYAPISVTRLELDLERVRKSGGVAKLTYSPDLLTGTIDIIFWRHDGAGKWVQ